MFIRLLVVFLWLIPEIVFAVCSGASPDWKAANCSNAEINACIAEAKSGDTIFVPSGTCTWSSYITIPSDKTIKLIGSGRNSTIINSKTKFIEMLADGSRVSGFRFNRVSGGDASDIIQVKGTGFRIDNNYMDDADYESHWVYCVHATAVNAAKRPEGVVDSNYMNHCKVFVEGSTNFDKDSGFWAAPSVVGKSGAVYFEDNTIDRGNIGSVIADSNYAGSYVLRYNNLIGGNGMAHSLQGSYFRGTKSWEYYGNSWSFPSSIFTVAFLRGGTGMFYYNLVTGPQSSFNITFDNVRSFQTGCCGVVPASTNSGMCDGSSSWDGNINTNGWPCRDQIGRGSDSALFNTTTFAASTSEPAYLWSNKTNKGDHVPVFIGNNCGNWIQNNRDYYDYSTSFNGTSGTGCGTLAARPSKCTAGVGYWATNQSCSDLTGMVGVNPSNPISGTLYKCTTANTWSASYTPFTYPHPLRSSEPQEPQQPPSTPQNLKCLF